MPGPTCQARAARAPWQRSRSLSDVGRPKASREKTSEPGRLPLQRTATSRAHGATAHGHMRTRSSIFRYPLLLPVRRQLRALSPPSSLDDVRRPAASCGVPPPSGMPAHGGPDPALYESWNGLDAAPIVVLWDDASFLPDGPACASLTRMWDTPDGPEHTVEEGTPSHLRVCAFSTRRRRSLSNAYGLRAGRLAM
ncbi:hypothetical protein BD309DRAFT_544057 [Dichomitus squalens]|nr:hypothetical protein BD309DRAFT_544057 [Dichomitus squalens]